ncbi:hypothetical protein MKX72_07360 [Priestia sp. FSL R5-0597]|uniref:hypothetical protein n=1 Tax=Priestia TaxID=2800373 RepID=UPI0012B9E3B6|nr:hypothetical protein [Priestia megaterium]
MTLREALKKVTKENRAYFHYKFPDTRFDKTIEQKTEQEFLTSVNRKTMNGFQEWEKSLEYANLVALYLQSKQIDTLHNIYKVVEVKALEGDDKAIATLLKLNKEINAMIKGFSTVQDAEEDDDGLSV